MVGTSCRRVHPTWVHVVSAPAGQNSHQPNHVFIYTRVPKGSPLSPASKAGDTLTPSAARHSSKKMPTPHTGVPLSLSLTSASTRFYQLLQPQSQTSTPIFAPAQQTNHVPYSQKSNSRECGVWGRGRSVAERAHGARDYCFQSGQTRALRTPWSLPLGP